jgi:hypothetical protein
MGTRESLHRLLDELSDEEVEALARIARDHGLRVAVDEAPPAAADRFIDASQYQALAAVWDNDDDAIFDKL